MAQLVETDAQCKLAIATLFRVAICLPCARYEYIAEHTNPITDNHKQSCYLLALC